MFGCYAWVMAEQLELPFPNMSEIFGKLAVEATTEELPPFDWDKYEILIEL